MRELNQIRDAVLSALRAEALTALEAYPDQWAKRYDCPVAAVAVETAESRTVGFCNYLGEVSDPETGQVRELYGKQLDAVIAVDIRGPRAADCERGCETAAEILLGGLPAGIHPGELTWEALAWERETEQFLRRGRLQCRAYFLAQTEDEETMFLDFRYSSGYSTSPSSQQIRSVRPGWIHSCSIRVSLTSVVFPLSRKPVHTNKGTTVIFITFRFIFFALFYERWKSTASSSSFRSVPITHRRPV